MGACYLTMYQKGGIFHRRKPISRDCNRQQTKYKDEKNSLTAWHVSRRGNRVNLKQRQCAQYALYTSYTASMSFVNKIVYLSDVHYKREHR